MENSNIVRIVSDVRRDLKKQLELEYAGKYREVKFKEELAAVCSSPLSIVSFNLDKLNDYISDDVYAKLKFYCDVIRMGEQLTDRQKDVIKSVFSKVAKQLESRIIEFNRIIDDLDNNNDEIHLLNQIIDKLNDLENKYFTKEEISKLYEIFKSRFGDDIAMEITLELATKSLKNLYSMELENVDDDSNIETINVSNLDENEVIKLFDKYNYNFYHLKESDRKEIIKYGNLDNIDAIFSILMSSNIRLSETQFIERSKGISQILCYSDASIVKNIINNIINNIKEVGDFSINNLNKYFVVYLKSPIVFLKLKNKVVKNGGSGGGSSVSIGHAYEHYLKNIELLKSIGVININEAMVKCSRFFSAPYKTNLRKKEFFDLYEIPVEEYVWTLCGFKAPTPLNTIDAFIELGCRDYLKSNFSRVQLRFDSINKHVIFYRIKYALMNGKELFNSHDEFLHNIWSDDSEFNIDNTNKSIKVDEYDFVNDRYALFSEYDKLIDSSDNDSISIAIDDPDIAKLNQYRVPGNKFIYNFDGVIISRYKLLRFYSTIKSNNLNIDASSIVFSACKNSILTKDEFDRVEGCILGIFEKELNGNKVMKK